MSGTLLVGSTGPSLLYFLYFMRGRCVNRSEVHEECGRSFLVGSDPVFTGSKMGLWRAKLRIGLANWLLIVPDCCVFLSRLEGGLHRALSFRIQTTRMGVLHERAFC